METKNQSLLKQQFENIFENALIQDIIATGIVKTFSENTIVVDIGDPMPYMPILLSGSIKIMREDNDDNELLLYYLEVGDTCAMTINCSMGKQKSNIRAITEVATLLVFVPIQKLEEWMIQYHSWRHFILESYNSRLMEALEAVDSLAFYSLEDRLHKYLKDKAMVTGATLLKTTHLQIANDLNSSRVVISRLLKKLQLDKKINVQRNEIEVFF